MIIGSGNKMTETREVSGFDCIDLAGVGKLVVHQTGAESLAIEGDDNIVPLVKTEVSEGKLVISLEEKSNVNPKVPLVYNVTVKDIRSLVLSGAGSIEANDLKAGDFETYVTGAGNVSLGNLDGESLRVGLSGAGDLILSGSVSSQTVSISGAGRYKADDLKSASADIVTRGVGNAMVWATDNLSATISGVGNIQYYGSPQVQVHRSGMGSIIQMGDK